MCGIFGILSADPRHHEHADAQLAVIEHRGPDERGHWSGDGVYLGNCRLSIIDLTEGRQPIRNEDGSCTIVYNGELYNFLDLRPELVARGHVFTTHSDTEVILHAYEEWGVECLRRFNGMFAFAIWDRRRRQLFIARDRIGEKPLYYYAGTDRLVFASEIKAIVADPSIPRAVNRRGLSNFLTFGHSLAPDTMYENIFKLPPGHYLLARPDGREVREYWDVGNEPPLTVDRKHSEDEYAEHVLSLLDDSVRRRMIADVPVGAFLSGGLDSSAIVALMQAHAPGRVKTFSLGFTIGGAYNELGDARRVANYLGTEHHELRVDQHDMVGTLQKLVWSYDEPFGDAANLPVYLLSEFARQHVKVVLAGEGGDELFGGYRRYVAEQAAGLYQRLPSFLANRAIPRLLGVVPRLRRSKRIVRTLPIEDPALRYASWLEVFTPEMLNDLLSPEWQERVRGYDPRWQYPHFSARADDERRHWDATTRVLYLDLKTWLPDTFMEKMDKAAMAVSLEGRLPFLDHRLVELAFQIPGEYKVRGFSTKRVLRRAVRHLLPPEVLTKPKHGFAVPTDPWFRGSLREFVREVLLDGTAQRRGYFKPAAVERLFRDHTEGREVHDTALWLLVNFELWHRTFIDR